MAVLDHDHRYTKNTPEDIRAQRICCIQFGLFWLGFFIVIWLVNQLFAFVGS